MRLLPVAVLIVTISLFGVLLFSFAQSQPDCYSISLGFTVTDAAQNIIDAQGLSLVEMQVDVTNSLNRYQQMTGRCFTGELGLIYGTLSARVFVVFASSNPDYGLTRVLTETEYYPEPFGVNTVGWQHSTDLELSAP
jgi:hypothetical protein